MIPEFHCEYELTEQLYKELADSNPVNPFYTKEYIKSKQILGYQPLVLSLKKEGEFVSICTAFMKSENLIKSLDIESFPRLPATVPFWEGLLSFCKKERIFNLRVNSYASDYVSIPNLIGETNRYRRNEYTIKLQQSSDLFKQMRTLHRRKVTQGTKSGLTIRHIMDDKTREGHFYAVAESMVRREKRGEIFHAVNPLIYKAVTESGSAEIFQAELNEKILSSVMILISPKGAYYYWAGTTIEGMKCGASHFLIYNIARILKERGMEVFNLGGTDLQNEGLVDFKRGFGSVEVSLESAEFVLGHKLKMKVGKAVRLVKRALRNI